MIDDLIQVLTLLVLLVVCFHYARRTADNLYLIFAALAFATLTLSDLYYSAHTMLREGMRMVRERDTRLRFRMQAKSALRLDFAIRFW